MADRVNSFSERRMSRIPRRPAFRIPVVILLLLVTQFAFAGEACHLAMAGEFRGDGMVVASVDAHSAPTLAKAGPCCALHPAPAPSCLVAFDGTPMTPVIGHVDVPAFAPFAMARAPSVAPARSARSIFPLALLAGSAVPVYISYQRFLS